MNTAGEQGAFVLGVRLDGVADIIKELDRIEENAKRVSKVLSNLGLARRTAAKLGLAKGYEGEFAEIRAMNDRMKKAFGELAGSTKSFNTALNDTNRKIKTIINSLNRVSKVGGDIFDKPNRSVKDFNHMMGIAIGKIVRYRIAFGMWRQVTDLMRGAVNITIEMNQTLTNLRKVMDPVTSDFNFLAQSAFDLGQRFASSALNVAESMKIWAQQGKTMVEVVKLTEATLLGVNSANLSAMESVEALTSATKAFNIEAIQATEIIDKWMAVQARHAVTAQDLANGVKTIGAAAKSAGVSIDELNGVIAAIGSVTRKTGREVANSFKTMLARIQRPAAIRAIQRLGIAVLESQNEIRQIPSVLEDLSLQWKDLEEATKQNLAVTIGGIRRYTDFIVLMDNFQEYLEATRHSFLAMGEAQVASQEQINSYAGQLEQLKAAAEELGYTLGESGILQSITNLARAFINIADSLKPIMPALSFVGRSFGFLLGIITPIYVGFLTLKGAVLLLGKVMASSLVGAVYPLITGFTKIKLAADVASKSIVAFSTRIAGLAGGIGAVLGLATAIFSFIGVFDTFFGKIDKANKSFSEFSEQSVATISKLVRIRDEYRKSVKDIGFLIKKKKELEENYKNIENAAEREERVVQDLVRSYPDLIKKYNDLFKATEFGKGFDFSESNLNSILNKYESQLERAEEITRESLEKSLKEHKEKHKLIIDADKSFRDKKARLAEEIAAISLTEDTPVISYYNMPSIPRETFGSYVQDLKSKYLKELESANIGEAAIKKFGDDIDAALSKLRAGKIDRSELIDDINKAFTDASGVLVSESEAAAATISRLNNILRGHDKLVEEVSDRYFIFKDRATALVGALAAFRKEAGLFERDNQLIKKSLHSAGIAFNDIAERVDFYRKKLESVYDLRAQHELKIAALEEEIANKQSSQLFKDELVQLQEKLEMYYRERDAVSDYLKDYERDLNKIYEEYDSLLSIQRDILHVNGANTREGEAALNKMKDLNKERIKEVAALAESYQKSNNLKGAYADIIKEVIKYETRLKAANKELVEQLRLASDMEKGYRENAIYSEILGNIAKARGQDERNIIDVQLKELEISEEIIRNQLSKNKWTYGALQLEQKILEIEHKREKLIAKRDTEIPELLKVSKLSKNVNLEVARYNALSNMILDSMAMQEHNQFKLIGLEEELAKKRAKYNEKVLQTAGLDQDSEKVLDRQRRLMGEIQEIQLKILNARIAINKQYRESVSQTAQELSSGISGPLGDIISTQIDKYERLREIQQSIIEAEKEKTRAILEGNRDGLAAANEKLKELTDEQNRLNSAAYQWKEAIKSISRNLIEISQKRYAEQIVDSLMNISKDGPTIGEKIAEGIEIKPEIVNFAITDKLENALITAGNNVSKDIYDAIARGAEILESSEFTGGLKNIQIDPSPIDSALKNGFSMGSDNIYASMVSGGIEAGRSIYTAMINAVNKEQPGFIGVNTSDASKNISSAMGVSISVAMEGGSTHASLKMKDSIVNGGDQAATSMEQGIRRGARDVAIAGLTSGELMASKLKVAVGAAAALLGQQIGVSLGTTGGGGGQWAGTGSQLGSMIGSTVLSTYGSFGQFIGGIAGGVIGGMIGGFLDDDAVDRQESLLTKIEENTAVLKDIDTRIFNAPTDFKLPAMATRGGNVQVYNQITVNINGAGNPRAVANEVVNALNGVSNYNTISGGI